MKTSFILKQWLARAAGTCLSLVTVLASAQPQAANSVAQTPLERFKNLLSNPPRIERMVYSQTLPRQGQKTPFLETGLAGSTNREFFELRYQTNGMLHRQLISPDHVGDNAIHGQCFSLWNRKFYFLDAKTKPALYVLEEEMAKRGVYSGPYHAAHIRMTQAAEPLNLGLSHIYPGSIYWDGESFSTVTMADKKPNYIRGRITGFSNGVPNELRVQYSNDAGSAEYRISYDYAAYQAPFYPNRIAKYFLRHGKEILYAEFHILSVVTAEKTLPESHFNLGTAIQESKSLLYLTNDAVYARLSSGQLIETPAGDPSANLYAVDHHKNRYYRVAAAMWTLALLLMIMKSWPVSKANQRLQQSN